MAYNDTDLASRFHSVKCFFKPSKNTSWIISLWHQIKVRVVAGFCINCNDFNIWVDSAIRCFENVTIVPINHKLLDCIFWKPGFPVICEVRNDRILFVKVLGVDHQSEVMITLKWVSRPLVKIFLHKIEQPCLVAFFVGLWVIPLIVRWDITSPK